MNAQRWRSAIVQNEKKLADLGTCPIGFAVAVLNEPDVLEELGLEGAAAIAPIIVGYPAGPVKPISRNEPRIVSWLK